MKQTYLYGALAAGLLFTGCKSDDFDGLDGNPGVATENQTLYVNMNIRGDIGSRAAANDGNPVEGTDFDNGVGESEVRNAYFVFYDENGNTVGEVVNVTLGNPVMTDNGEGTVEKYYQSTVPVSVYKGESKPTQVVCYINPISPASLQNPLSTIETVTRQELYTTSNNKKYFAMSNSVYYPTNTDAAKPRVAIPVDPTTQLFSSKEAAEAALTNDPTKVINIYVERYASKLNFTAPQEGDAGNKPYNTFTSLINNDNEVAVELNFVPKYWVVNAACQESYVVKSFRKESEAGTILSENYTFQEMNTRLNANTITGTNANPPQPVYNGLLQGANAWTWNNPVLHRSFWSCSPAYFNQDYPEVSSDVVEGGINQHYYSYNELKGIGVDEAMGYASDDTSDHYFHETTVGGRGLVSVNPAAAVPSVIYVGDYTVKVNGVTQAAETTFYTYLKSSNGNPLVFFEGAGAQGKSVVENGESMIRRFIEQASCLFKRVGTEYVRFDITDEADMAILVAALKVDFPNDEVKGDLVLSSRYRTLLFKDDAVTTGIYVANGNGYKSIGSGENQISLNDASRALMNNVGYAVKYHTGSGYFNIPVKHYGWYRNGNDQKDDAKIDWNKVRVGDFGMVRNHSYSIQVNEIKGLATGIGGHDDPIVPPSDSNDYFVAYRVNILQWAVVPTQITDL